MAGFNFNSASTSSGFTFGSTGGSSQNTGFSFANQASGQPRAALTFGGSSTVTTSGFGMSAAKPGPFSFNATAPGISQSSSTAFTLGAAQSATSSVFGGVGGSNSGSINNPPAFGNSPFSFNAPASQSANKGFGFGQTDSQPKNTMLFGATQNASTSQPSTASQGFSFGSQTPTNSATQGFTVGNQTPASSTSTGFGFGSQTPSSAAQGFTFGTQNPQSATSKGFSFGTQSSASSLPHSSSEGFSVGMQGTTATPFGFGNTSGLGPNTSGAFGFNSLQTSNGSTAGIAFGQTSSTGSSTVQSQPAAPTFSLATTNKGGIGFNAASSTLQAGSISGGTAMFSKPDSVSTASTSGAISFGPAGQQAGQTSGINHNFGSETKSGTTPAKSGLPQPFANFPPPPGVVESTQEGQKVAASNSGGFSLAGITTSKVGGVGSAGFSFSGGSAAFATKPAGSTFGQVGQQPQTTISASGAPQTSGHAGPALGNVSFVNSPKIATTTTIQSGPKSVSFSPSTLNVASPIQSLLSQPTTTPASKPVPTHGILGPKSALAQNLSVAITSANTATAPAQPPGGLLAISTSTAQATAIPGQAAQTKPQQAGTSSAGVPTTSSSENSALPDVTKYRELEEQINKWMVELEEHEKVFIQQATQLNGWDKMLMENSVKISQLDRQVEQIAEEQVRLDQDLDFVSAQHHELDELLTPLEQELEISRPATFLLHADLEREQTYKLAENVDAQLKRMGQDLKEIVDYVNISNGPGQTANAMQQVSSILNAHVDSLQWIQQHAVALQNRVEEVGKITDAHKRSVERSINLAYSD